MSGDEHPDRDSPEWRRLLDWLNDTPATLEPVHANDCAPCDVASDVAGTVAAYFNPHTLPATLSGDGAWRLPAEGNCVPGDTKLDQLTRVVAHVLHRRLIPGHKGWHPSLGDDELLGVRPRLEDRDV